MERQINKSLIPSRGKLGGGRYRRTKKAAPGQFITIVPHRKIDPTLIPSCLSQKTNEVEIDRRREEMGLVEPFPCWTTSLVLNIRAGEDAS